MSVPHITPIAQVIASPSAAMDFLFENHLVYTAETGRGLFTCDNCGRSMKLVRRNVGDEFWRWQCPSFTCDKRKTKSVRTNSVFFGIKSPLNTAISFMYFFAAGCNMGQSVAMSGLNERSARRMVTNLTYSMEESLDEEQMRVGKRRTLFFFFKKDPRH
jgi:hypothetical protein